MLNPTLFLRFFIYIIFSTLIFLNVAINIQYIFISLQKKNIDKFVDRTNNFLANFPTFSCLLQPIYNIFSFPSFGKINVNIFYIRAKAPKIIIKIHPRLTHDSTYNRNEKNTPKSSMQIRICPFIVALCHHLVF